MQRRKVNLFIVGAARSGTTALWYCLQHHPEIFMPTDMLNKEPAFFSQLKKTRYKTIKDYMKIFMAANKSHIWIGDASTAYLTDPDSAANIHDYNPQARIIILLRNPVQRAYSLYNWMAQEGYEYAGSFETALEIEKSRSGKNIPNYFEPEYFFNYMYFESGCYAEQVQRFLVLFKKNVFILKFEEFITDPIQKLAAIAGFLGISSYDWPRIRMEKNSAVRIISPMIQFLLRKVTQFCLSTLSVPEKSRTSNNLYQLLQQQLSYHIGELSTVTSVSAHERQTAVQILSAFLNTCRPGESILEKNDMDSRDRLVRFGHKDVPPPAMSRATLAGLNQKYQPYNRRLADLTGITWQ